MKKIHYLILFNLIAMALFSCNQSTVKKKRFPPQEYFTGELLPLAQAIYDDDAAKVKAYIQSKNIDVNSADSIAEYTLLLYSINVGSKKAMKTLLEMGADPNKVSHTKAYEDQSKKSYLVQDRYPLANATYHSDMYYVKLLIKYGANPKLGNPLHESLLNTPEISTTQMLQFLLDNGANINKQDEMQRTPLRTSLSMHRNEYSTFLIDRGADLTIVDNRGKNAPEFLQQELIDKYSKRYGYDVNKSLEYLGRWQTTITAMQKQGYVFTYLINENDRVVYEGKK